MIKENNISKIIIFIPIIFLVTIVISISYFFISYDYKYFNTEIKDIENQYIEAQKDFIKLEIEKVADYIEYKKNLTENRLKKDIKNRTIEAYNIAVLLYNRFKNQKSKTEIENIIRDTLRVIKFHNGRGYYFGLDSKGVVTLFADKPHLEGVDILKVKSSDGKYPITDIVNIGLEQDEGYYSYLWSKPNSTGTNHKKVAFVKYIKELDWIIGTGEYIDDVESDIREEVLDRIKNIKYGANGYVFVLDIDGVVLSHPKMTKSRSVIDLKDKNNFEFIKEFIKISKTKERGYVEYYLSNLEDKDSLRKKISYIQYLPKWDWIIGTGVYFNEIESAIENKKDKFQSRIETYTDYIVILILVLLFIIITLSFLFSKTIKNILNRYKNIVKDKENKLLDLNRNLEHKIEKEINKRRKNEQLLVQQSKMAQMGEMINSIAHQWRQPLNSLGLRIQDIQEAYEFDEIDEEYLKSFVGKSMNQIEFMSTTIDDFRNFFKPNKSKEKYKILDIINDVLSVLSFDLKYKHIQVNIDGENFEVNIFVNEFKQVLLNLINNAKDEIVREQSINREFEGEINITFECKNDKKTINIEDNAKGVPKDIIDRIFEPYFTTKEQGKGTGIGLYMSKMIIENNMQGRIYLKNSDKGAKFTIELE